MSVIAEHAPKAKDLTQEKGHRSRPLTEQQKRSNRKKSSVRSRVEHSFFVMKRQFRFTKVRYKGLAKNAHFLFVSCALVNMVMAKKVLLEKRRRPLQPRYA